MLKLEFMNATAEDHGYGLEVNGKSLEDIISTALGTRVGSNHGKREGCTNFSSNCCNIVVIIDPQPVQCAITDDEGTWNSVEEMEEDMREQFKQKNAKADPES